MTAAFILSELQSVGTPEKAVHLSRFFKTGPGQYGEGDQFLGVVVPQTRSIAKANKVTPFDELQLLLDSPWHEARLCALLILVYRFQDRKAMPEEREAIFRFYLKNMRRCNNWDLVDLPISWNATLLVFLVRRFVMLSSIIRNPSGNIF